MTKSHIIVSGLHADHQKSENALSAAQMPLLHGFGADTPYQPQTALFGLWARSDAYRDQHV